MKRILSCILAACCLLSLTMLTACDVEEVLGEITEGAGDFLNDLIGSIGGRGEGGTENGGGNTENGGGNTENGGGNTENNGGNTEDGSGTPESGGGNVENAPDEGGNTTPSKPENSYAEKGDTPTINGKNPNQLYAEAAAKLTQNAHNYESTATVLMYMTYGGETRPFTMTMISHEENGNVHTKLSGDEMLIGAMANEAWYVDGWLYQIRDGKKIKVEMSMQDYLDKFYGAEEGEQTLMNIPESWLSNVGFFATENGGYFRVILRGQEMLDALDRVGIGSDGTTIDYVTYDVHFNSQGELTHIETSYEVEIQGGIHCDVTGTTVYKNVGCASPIAPPADADEFQIGILK